jgi:hypothetical protein
MVEDTISAFDFSKKYDLSILSIEGRVLDQCRAFDQLVSVDAYLWAPDMVAKGRTIRRKHCKHVMVRTAPEASHFSLVTTFKQL